LRPFFFALKIKGGFEMSFTPRAGNVAKVVKGSSTVLGMGNWKMDGISTDMLEYTSFGDTAKKYITGMLDYGQITFSGFYDPADTTGQAVLISANLSNTKLNDIKLYIDNSSYWTANVTADSASGAYVTSVSIGTDKSGLATIDFTLKATGPWVLV
jgi:hypothetical protein